MNRLPMAKARSSFLGSSSSTPRANDNDEDVGLLASHNQDVAHAAAAITSPRSVPGDPEQQQQQQHQQTHQQTSDSKPPSRRPQSLQNTERRPSALHSPSLTGESRTPRTPNRVRFDLQPIVVGGGVDAATANNGRRTSNGSAPGGPGQGLGGEFNHPLLALSSPSSRSSFDSYDSEFGVDSEPENAETERRLPLLTNIEAPSVSLANSGAEWANGGAEWAEDHNRPKSGLRAAFMNMANSIIGAGIIGQPYAFKNAGLLAGVFLLISLTVVVDWTICLIVINSKLSGANSFQGTVERCFGKPGLIAVSVAQWAFAFGGMVAFGVIVGDSIPHVFLAIWPDLRNIPVLGLLADRRAVIVIFTLGISYPLTLYRDISKVRASIWGAMCIETLITFLVCILIKHKMIARQSKHLCSSEHAGHCLYCRYSRPFNPQRAEGLL